MSDTADMSRFQMLTDAQFNRIADLIPNPAGRPGRPYSDPRRTIEGIIYRLRAGIPWRDLPECFGAWQTVARWHHRLASDGTWDTILTRLLVDADAHGQLDWSVSVDSTISRAHQHATNITRHTGGWIELQQSAHRAA